MTAAGLLIFIHQTPTMPHLDYTQRARRFSLRFPLLNSLLIQINFWVPANIVLAVLLHLMYSSVHVNIPLPLPPELWPTIIIGIIIGLLHGTVLGILEYFLEKQFFRRYYLPVKDLGVAAHSCIAGGPGAVCSVRPPGTALLYAGTIATG